MKTTLYRASSRGHANHGWLDSYHTFSFANYYDPNRINFGALRVVNDDIVKGGEGFGTHPHDNMEIISIPLYGDLEHKDSMGHTEVIRSGEVQVMSAGTGITHSEYNSNKDKPVNFFQIWVFPDKNNVEPRYDQRAFDFIQNKNQLVQIVGPVDDKENEGLWIHQSAWFNIGTFEKETQVDYKLKKQGNGVFAMVVEGEFTIDGKKLYRRDALGISDIESIKLTADTDNARILLIDVPMVF
ncbi:pirin family protein [Dysgonomonas sp. Marseille-P4677]|uniref:pirin family protein n=1 Tax=Dysgonomonas sp. Marseille-P4677 TaxID=2364790 RepID=UPI001912F9D1|nr:pirin family protein [Dysgonomonas sp. Marseille-P4677]MBK5720261.1 pirin family protein [Dysgonomonas sp. Marseille-P4677]